MRLNTIVYPILMLITVSLNAQNFVWKMQDKRLIEKVGSKYLEGSDEILSLFEVTQDSLETYRYDNLGFDYKVVERAIGGGYISIRTKFYFRRDSLLGYRIFLELPDKKPIIQKYKNWYRLSFNINEYKEAINYNLDVMNEPLDSYHGTITQEDLNRSVKFYFSTESGIEYGLKGGYSYSYLKNRKHFIEIAESLTGDELEYLMYSKNPATRFTAIEYYLKNREKFRLDDSLEHWIKKVFKSTTYVKTMNGCSVEYSDSRLLFGAITGIEISSYAN
ncbi:MAG: hypothetical protein AAGI23_11295 [Bacteroidota bacterium]